MKPQLRILYLVPRFHPFKGGAEENTFQLASRMAAAGHEVTVLTTNASPDGTPLAKLEMISSIKVIRVRRWNQQLNLGFYPGLLPQLLLSRVDIIHVENGPGFIWQEFCLVLKRLTDWRVKIITTPHGPFLSVTPGKLWKKIIAAPAKLLMPIYFRLIWKNLFSLFIQVNPHQEDWLQSQYGVSKDKIITIPNGIENELISPMFEDKFSSPTPVITFVGRFEQYKGIQDIISAVSRIKQSGPRVKFKALGRPGDYYPVLINQVAKLGLDEEVEFVINPADELKEKIMREESVIHILPSEWEATGIVLLEAMATGNAIITTTGNEAHDLLIQQGENGFYYDFGDIDTLSDRLIELLNDPYVTKQMAEINLKRIHSYTWERIFTEYQSTLLGLYDQTRSE